ncbi:hypothetical protein V8C86DRAFT_2649637 [Haematococcus lacustris]
MNEIVRDRNYSSCDAESSTFADLGLELGRLIASQLLPSDLASLACTCALGRELAGDAACWLPALRRYFGTLPREQTRAFMHAISTKRCTWRDFVVTLRLQVPAALVAPSPKQCIPSASAQYPSVLHVSGLGQRILSMQFPVLPAGRYAVVWRIRPAPGFLRGYISFHARFHRNCMQKSNKAAAADSDIDSPAPAWAAGPLWDMVLGDAAQPPSPPSTMTTPWQWHRSATLTCMEPSSADMETGIHNPVLPSTTNHSFLTTCRSKVLGSYSSTWSVVDRHCFPSLPRPCRLHPNAAPPNPPTLPGSVPLAQHPPGPPQESHTVSDRQEGAAGWADVVVGSCLLRAPCSPAFMFVVLQTAQRQSAMQGAPGGLHIDYVLLRPVEPDWSMLTLMPQCAPWLGRKIRKG